MIKKILIVTAFILTLSYSAYAGYQCYENNIKLTQVITTENQLKKDYAFIENKASTVELSITNLESDKTIVKTNIDNDNNSLTQLNNKIAVKAAALKKKKEQQTKTNISTGTGSKIAYLTFDDGPSKNTSKILDILNEYGIKATYFVNGREDSNSIAMYKRIVNEGHSIGNHVYSHAYQDIYSSVGSFDYYFNRLQDLIANTTGVNMKIMRFPGGSNNTVSNKYNYGIMDTLTDRYRELGYTYFDWNVSAGDSGGIGSSAVISNVVNGSRNKKTALILMHDTKSTTPATLATIIQSLSNMGFKFMALTPSSYNVQFK